MTHTTAFFSHEIPPDLPLVRLEHVCLCFGDTVVLRDANLRIERGMHLALLGRNGAGKSSLLRLLQGDLRPSRIPAGVPGEAEGKCLAAQEPGRVYWAFEGREENSALAARQYARLLSSEQQANYVRRGWNITGEEILLSGLDNAPMVYGEVSAALYAAAAELAEAAGASHLLAVEAPAMSQGQLRLMLILRALMGRPQLLLLDEPFDGLDRDARNAVSHCLELAAQKGATLLVTAHRKRDIPAFISRALLLENGEISACDLATCPLLPPATEKEACGVTVHLPDIGPVEEALARADNPFLRALDEKIRPLLLLRDVDVFIDRQKVLSGISWRVEPGDRWVISGPNGSGKSTLMRLVYGEEFAAWGGSLEWCGGLRLSQEELRTGVGFVSDRVLHRYEYDIRAEEVVVSGMRGSMGLYEEPQEWELEAAQYWLNLLELGRFAKKNLYSLSGGTARKVLLARALAGSPPVLLLDEPCTGLDCRSRSLFLNALELLAGQGVTLIYASHHEEDRAAFFDKELRLEQGRIVSASGSI